MNATKRWTAAAMTGGVLIAAACLAQGPKEKAKQGMAAAEVVAALGQELRAEAAADQFSGAVLLAKDGKPIFREAYGMADLGLKAPNNPKTKFNLGSINKMFTRIAIEQLELAGKLSLDDTIAKWIPDYPDKDVAAKVTLRQLIAVVAAGPRRARSDASPGRRVRGMPDAPGGVPGSRDPVDRAHPGGGQAAWARPGGRRLCHQAVQPPRAGGARAGRAAADRVAREPCRRRSAARAPVADPSAGTWRSPSRTADRASPRSTCPSSSSASTAPTPRAPDPPAAPASDSPSSSSSPPPTAATSGSTASPAAARRSASVCRA